MPTAAIHSILVKKENAHDYPIYCCAWTKATTSSEGPSKNFILTGGLDNLIKVWSLQNNKLDLVNTLSDHSLALLSIAVSPDGHSIASTALDSSLIIWDLLSGQQVHEILTGDTNRWKVTFSPDGSQVATGSITGVVLIYSIKDGTMDKLLDTRGKFVLSIAWSPCGKYIACGAADGSVCVLDVAQAKLIHTIAAHGKTVRSVVFSPDSRLLASASDDGTVKLHNVASAGHISTLEHNCWAVCAAFSPDGSRVASAAADGSVRVALVDDLKLLHTFHEHADTVWEIQFNERGDNLLSISKDKCINIYECPIPPKPVKK